MSVVSCHSWRFFFIGRPAASETVSPTSQDDGAPNVVHEGPDRKEIGYGIATPRVPRLPREPSELTRARDWWARSLPELVLTLCDWEMDACMPAWRVEHQNCQRPESTARNMAKVARERCCCWWQRIGARRCLQEQLSKGRLLTTTAPVSSPHSS